jgi:hypothetical protein
MKPQTSVLFGAALALAGCVDPQPGEKGDGKQNTHEGETGIAISAAVTASADTDVAFMDYGIERVACVEGEEFEPLRLEIRVELESMQLPGGIPEWENSPLDKDSEHQFADHFEALAAGCYNVSATPLAASGGVSAECAAAHAKDIEVLDGETTEIFMISQCKGDAVGAIDSVVALNKPPTLQSLTFSPSKFLKAGQKTTVCVTASDPNSDPVEFEWDQIGGAMCGASVISNQHSGDTTTECVDVEPMELGNYLFEVRIYDLLRDENKKLIRFETWLAEHGYPNTSHDSLRFPVYVGE